MGFLSSQETSHVESIVFFLSESLRAAVEAGDRLQHSPYEMPQLAPSMDCSEIASKLAGFRHHMSELWSRELLMLTKILRARELAKDLRLYAPELKPEIDTFRLATVIVTDLRDALAPARDSVFNGTVQPKCFLEERGYANIEKTATTEPLPGYKVAGQLDVRLLIDACEALHFGLAARYGFGTPTLLLQEQSDMQVFILADEADEAEADEEPFLLSDWGEIIPDTDSPGHSTRNTPASRQSLIH